MVNSSKPIKQDDKCHNVAGINKRSKKCDVTYTISVVVLASQEVDVLANLTNEKVWNLYGYDEMTRPHFSIQTQV